MRYLRWEKKKKTSSYYKVLKGEYCVTSTAFLEQHRNEQIQLWHMHSECFPQWLDLITVPS